MCDLWTETLSDAVAPGAVAGQIRETLAVLPPARWIKLYNAGSFFDPRAIPPEDHADIAALAAPFERVIVESHPALVGDACLRFRDRLAGRLEVAMGLETVHPDVLPRLNKRMTLGSFDRAARLLEREGVALRAFVLLGLPFVSRRESLEWARRSVAYAFGRGASAVSVIPTRAGNGALDALRDRGEFQPPTLGALEDAVAYGIGLRRGRVFADLWSVGALEACAACRSERLERLGAMNLSQAIVPPIRCTLCGPAAACSS